MMFTHNWITIMMHGRWSSVISPVTCHFWPTHIQSHLLYWSWSISPHWLGRGLLIERQGTPWPFTSLTCSSFHLPIIFPSSLSSPLTPVSPCSLGNYIRRFTVYHQHLQGKIRVCECELICVQAGLVVVCIHIHFRKSVWVVKDSDSLQAVLDKEWTTKAIVETIFSLPLILELCGQAGSGRGRGRGDEDQFPCRISSSAVFLIPTYCIEEEEEENETKQEKA